MPLLKGYWIVNLGLFRDCAQKKLTLKLQMPERNELVQIDTHSPRSTDHFFVKGGLVIRGQSSARGIQFRQVAGKIWNVLRNILFYISLR